MLKYALTIFVSFSLICGSYGQRDMDITRIRELDEQMWKEVSRAVREGDFLGYKATFHNDAVFVITTGSNKESYPISKALDRWKQGFINTKQGKQFDNVEFRFSQRLGDATTAHETGIFHFTSRDKIGNFTVDSYIHFEALLIKKGQKWKMLMEFQKKKATQEEWEALK